MRLLYILVFGAWTSWLAADPAFAEKRVALIIGNSAYENVARLGNPANDAAAMTTTLKQAGFDLVDSRRNLNIADMRRAFRDFSDKARDADVAVVYYAGHGIEVDGTNYLIPVDAVLERDLDVYDEAFPLDRILATIEPAKQLRLVILDACRDNPFAKTMRRTSGTRAVGRGLARIEPASPNTLIAFASKAGSTTSDGDSKNSPFTSALVKFIATPGLDLRKAFGFVRDDVLKNTSNRQEPYVYGSLGGDDVPLVPAPAVAASHPDPQAEIRHAYELALQLGTKEGWTAFLVQFPEGFYASLAKAQLNKIASEEARAAEAEKARLAVEAKARLAADAVKQAEQIGVAAQARTAEPARSAAETAMVEKPTAMKAETGIAETPPADDKAAAAESQETKPPQQVASLPTETPVIGSAEGPLIKQIKTELKRTGCYSGRIDASWPKESKESNKGSSNDAVRKFARYANLSSAPEEPSRQLLELIKSKPDGFCPLECGARELERNGRCVKREAPARAIKTTPTFNKPLSGLARADQAYGNGTYRGCMGPVTGCYARTLANHDEDYARRWCSRRPTC
jgi:caspase domain-containing protein